ncbi:MAG: purine-nucleoside phosphorylase [Bacteroidetes bacterium]|nr:MAG: purine-nucleoside phosphorylase [Bacteroidota bacterium]
MLNDSIKYIRSKVTSQPTVGIVLGSGLGDFGEQVVDPVIINTRDVPNYPVSTVHGHSGKLIFGTIRDDKRCSAQLLVFQGRVHFYESNSLERVIYPIDVANALGVTTLLITNAAGGINRLFQPGDLMLIRDYINLTYENPLIGRGIRAGERMAGCFHEGLLKDALTAAKELHIPVQEGVYCWTKGPTYETASEIRMMQRLGADAVGMSTVPEVMTAAHFGMKVLGISCITNMATGITGQRLSHDEVTETANMAKAHFTSLVREIVLGLR